ncbi:hypothetical protein PHISCL_04443 [Aspergillus sclerotialis]|uniref:Uncharacterized protein n=1 Tax=Aspergillus sclerotialis TaxID=2070753 RepID=A0A3A2ZJ15_9EURO|nr:hypothetical protein PHISCL_04443 [Aspergillus sclerotialis]
MYHPETPLRMNQQLLHRYESEEEDISESEPGQDHDHDQRHDFSPIVSQPAAESLDSDLSADDRSTIDSDGEEDNNPHLLSPYAGSKASRPVSMDTVKRNSGATFVGNTFFLDHDDDMLLELPPDDSPRHSSMFLEPTVYVPDSPLPNQPPSPSASILSEEQADLLVAEKVTYMEPHTRPNLIIISPFARSCSQNETPSRPQSESSSSPEIQMKKRAYRNSSVIGGEVDIPWPDSKESHFNKSNLYPINTQTSAQSDLELSPKSTPPVIPSATTAPEVTALPPISTRPRPISFSRPLTANPDKSSIRSRIVPDLPRRPPSMRSMSSASFSYTNTNPSAPASPYQSEDSASYISTSHSVHRPQKSKSGSLSGLSRTSSPVPYYSSPTFYRDRTGSSYSSSSMLGHRSPHLFRNQAVKHSATSSISTASVLSDADSVHTQDQTGESEGKDLKKKASKGRGLRLRQRSEDKDESGAIPTSPSPLKGLMGLKLGRKMTTSFKSSS